MQPEILQGFNRCRTAMFCRGLARMDFVPPRHVVSTLCTQFEEAPGPVRSLHRGACTCISLGAAASLPHLFRTWRSRQSLLAAHPVQSLLALLLEALVHVG